MKSNQSQNKESKTALEKQLSGNPFTRRSFLQSLGLGTAVLGLPKIARADDKPIQGFGKIERKDASKNWKPVSDRKIRVGIAGYGFCKFGADFAFQDHPNVEIVGVTDLFPDRCAGLAEECRCSKTYPSLEEMVKEKNIEAVFIATDPPSHARLAMEAMKHGKHVASAVPAVFGSLEDADRLIETVKSTGLNYMMFETSSFHEDCHAMRQIYDAGGFGKIIYSEGEYFHYMDKPLDSYKGWRIGTPPQWYPTHSNAYYICATGGSFTEVSCLGIPSVLDYLQPGNNHYKNPFGTEIAMFRTSEGGVSRMGVSWDTPGEGGETGRLRGQKGSYYGEFDGLVKPPSPIVLPPLPPTVEPGDHGGSHGYLMNEFVMSILLGRKPSVDVAMALNLTVAGIKAHESALKGGETLKIPQFKLA